MKHKTLLLIAVSLIFGYTHTVTATSLHSLNTYGAFLNGSAAVFNDGFGPNSGIDLPDGQSGQFSWSFTVPLDHIPGNPIVIGLTWHTAAPTPCRASLRSNFISVARLGSTHIQGPTASSGLTPLDGQETLVAGATNTSEIKLFAVQSPNGVTRLQPLDVVTFGMFRAGASAVDTCRGDVTIQGAWIYIL